jgi:hypothetical protein
MTEQDRSKFFKLIDKHASSIFRCFVSEFPEVSKGTGLVICFRPVDADRDSPLRYACRYVRIAISDLTGPFLPKLTEPVRTRIDEELSWFTRANHTILENK